MEKVPTVSLTLANPIIIFVSHYWSMAKPTSQSGKKIGENCYFLFRKKLGKNLSVRVMRKKDNNWNGLRVCSIAYMS